MSKTSIYHRRYLYISLSSSVRPSSRESESSLLLPPRAAIGLSQEPPLGGVHVGSSPELRLTNSITSCG